MNFKRIILEDDIKEDINDNISDNKMIPLMIILKY